VRSEHYQEPEAGLMLVSAMLSLAFIEQLPIRCSLRSSPS
jgi:hypothetical protein